MLRQITMMALRNGPTAAAGASSRAAAASATARARPLQLRCLASAAAQPKLNVNKCVDKAHEAKSFKEIIKLPPGALQGLKAGVADEMLAALKLKTIEDLAKWKHWRLARAIATLAKVEEVGKRPEGAAMNVNSGVDAEWEGSSLAELLAAPPSALQGLAPWSDTVLAALKVKSVGDLAKWKYAVWADALVAMAGSENAEGGSR